MRITDPFDVKNSIRETSLDQLEADEIYQKGVALAEAVFGLYGFVREHPRWESLWDQAQRAASSVPLNYAEGATKLMGYCRAGWMTARGSLFETFAALSIGPEEFRRLKLQAVDLIKLMDAAILALPERSDRAYYRN